MRFALAALLLVAAQANATKARLRALNQSDSGSYYIYDARNIFLNPAQITLLKNNLAIEWGQATRNGRFDEVPEAEGGFVMDVGPGKAGAQLGRVSRFDRLVRTINTSMDDLSAASGVTNFGEGQNNVDLTYGGGTGAGMGWGAGLGITRSKTATGATDKQTEVQAFDFRGGIHTEQFEAFGSFLLGAQSETEIGTTKTKLEEDWGLSVGAGMNMGVGHKLFGNIRYDDFEIEAGAGTVQYDGRGLEFLAGIANWMDFENNARLFYTAELSYLEILADDKKAADVNEKRTVLALPLTIGVEADANSWLSLRTSVKQGILLGQTKTTEGGTTDDKNKWENSPNDTAVAFGGSVTLNKFNFDAALVQSMDGDDTGRAEAALTYLF